MSPTNSHEEILLGSSLSDIDIQALRQYFHIVYQELHWEMEDTKVLCENKYGLNISDGSSYRDIVNNLLNSIEPIVEEERLLLQGEDINSLLFIKKPEWYRRAIESIEHIRKYHRLLLSNPDFAKYESLRSKNLKASAEENPYRALYAEVEHDKEKFLNLVESLSFPEVLIRYENWRVRKILGDDSRLEFEKAVNH